MKIRNSGVAGLLSGFKLPEVAAAKNGGSFCPNSDFWNVRSAVESGSFEFSFLRSCCSTRLFSFYKLAQIASIRTRSLSGCGDVHRGFQRCIELANQTALPGCIFIDELSLNVLLNFKAECSEADKSGWNKLKGFLKRSYMQGYRLLSNEAYDFLKHSPSIKLSSIGPTELLCPYYGPFSVLERDEFNVKLHSAFSNGIIDDEEYVILMLSYIFGAL